MENIAPKLALQSKHTLKDETNNPLKSGKVFTKLEAKASLDPTWDHIVADEAKKEWAGRLVRHCCSLLAERKHS